MKKVLFATTALIATASVAAADVRLSGYGRFGLDYNDANDRAVNGISKTTITSRLRLQFDMSTETDSGVVLGARFRAQAESRDNTPGGAFFNGARFFAKAGGLEIGVAEVPRRNLDGVGVRAVPSAAIAVAVSAIVPIEIEPALLRYAQCHGAILHGDGGRVVGKAVSRFAVSGNPHCRLFL